MEPELGTGCEGTFEVGIATGFETDIGRGRVGYRDSGRVIVSIRAQLRALHVMVSIRAQQRALH